MLKNLFPFLTVCGFLISQKQIHDQIVINEFVASSAAGITDPDFGDKADWIKK
ncbi:MAG: hypothetical protein ABJC12_11585 [Saprospiraceae bacterium]